MSDFPRRSLENIATHLDETLGEGTVGARDVRQAVKAHEQLSDRCNQQRLYIGQLERLLRQSDTAIPPDVAALSPDGES